MYIVAAGINMYWQARSILLRRTHELGRAGHAQALKKKQFRALDKKHATFDRCNSADGALFIYGAIAAKQCHQ